MEKLGPNTNALNWFEIPVTDTKRAKRFYDIIFDIDLQKAELMGMEMLMFPSMPPKVGGALVKSPQHRPSMSGAIVYLNANPDLQIILNRIEEAGGKIQMKKTLIDAQTGYMAFFSDTEGNTIGLHSNK